MNTEVFFETLYGLARDGKTDENGVPNLLQRAVTLSGINEGEIYLAKPPVPVQKAFLAALAPVAISMNPDVLLNVLPVPDSASISRIMVA